MLKPQKLAISTVLLNNYKLNLFNSIIFNYHKEPLTEKRFKIFSSRKGLTLLFSLLFTTD